MTLVFQVQVPRYILTGWLGMGTQNRIDCVVIYCLNHRRIISRLDWHGAGIIYMPVYTKKICWLEKTSLQGYPWQLLGPHISKFA